MEEAITLVILGTLAGKFVDWVKFIQAKDWNATITQLAVWGAGVAVILLGANADAFEALMLPGFDRPIGDMNFYSLMLIGLSLTSLISFAYDFKKAIDGTDSAKTPHLTSISPGPPA